MRFLVLSDIHGNRFGLEAVLASAHGQYDQLLSLGDVVGYGAHPNECCEILQQNNVWCLSGNHDAAALGLIDIEWFNPVAKAAILWTREQLNPTNREWLSSLKGLREWREYSFQAVHGSLREPWEEYITGTYTAEPTLALMNQPICFFGHTHVAVSYNNLDKPGKKYQMQEIPFPYGGEIICEDEWKYLVNPGSCGQPRDGNSQARYALFDSETRRIEIKAIDYDREAARAAIYNAGLPKLLGDRLLQGR